MGFFPVQKTVEKNFNSYHRKAAVNLRRQIWWLQNDRKDIIGLAEKAEKLLSDSSKYVIAFHIMIDKTEGLI